MMKCSSLHSLYFIAFYLNVINAATTNDCKPCVPKEECRWYGDMSREQQQLWLEQHPCRSTKEREADIYGFASVAKGDYVCCSSSLWTYENADSTILDFSRNRIPREDQYPGMISYNPDDYMVRPKTNWSPGNSLNSNYFPGESGPFNNIVYNYNSPSRTQNPYVQGRASPRECSAQLTSYPPNPDSACCGREASDTDTITGSPIYNQNRPTGANFNQQNWVSRHNSMIGPGPLFTPLGMARDEESYSRSFERSIRSPQHASDNVTVTIDTRIAGGKATELYQYPWTVYIKITFENGNQKRSTFSCGGSLISSQYVLTAGHCLYKSKEKLVGVEVHLAEYDKRTFPRDCRSVSGPGRECIDNIVIYADDAIIHNEYDDDRLKNDIALLKLHSKAPYTEYIRPICLPFIDIDDPNYSNLPLFVAGWGRDGAFESDIKQSTIVNLVPQRECAKSYPDLTRRHLCAAGYNGQDTCKGDSGGPLMVLYRGKYYVAGIVSGKRADSPCGTSVPSLYTNVYHYIDWIRRNTRG